MVKRSDWVLRSMMFVPGHNDKIMSKALKSNADALILDLEDSVRPYENKSKARELIRSYASNGAFTNCNKKIFVRINDRDTDLTLVDLEAITVDGIDAILMPKVYNKEDICYVDFLLEAIEHKKHLKLGSVKIAALIETAAAVLNVQEICKASERVIAVTFGCEDFIADLEGYHDKEHESIYTPRSLISLGARAVGVIPIDTVHIDVHNLEDLEVMLKTGRKFGFEGQLVLHPKELPLVHQYYTPSEKEVLDAKAMLDLYKQAEKENRGVAVFNGKFVGPPMVIAAEKTLKRSFLIENIEEEWFPKEAV